MKKTFCLDIDNTICRTKSSNYSKSRPLINKINFINKLLLK